MAKRKTQKPKLPSFDWTPYRVFLEDEAPNIGCGWRGVYVRSKNGKVTIRERYTNARKDISWKQWEDISSTAQREAP